MAASQSVTADRTGDATSARLMIGLIAAEILTMAGTAAFASTLVELSRLWHLDSTHAAARDAGGG